MSYLSRTLRLLLAATIAFAATGTARAQDKPYPSQPIRIVLPFPAGGSTDPIARLVGQKLSQALGQPVIIDNRPGGNTIIGTDVVAKAPPDGYTVLFTASTHVINPLLMSNLPYDASKDFAPVASLVRSEFVLVAHPSVRADNLQEFIALAKANPGDLNYATSGTGNPNHLAGAHFSQVAGVQLTDVPYKGGGPAINDLLGGQVQAMFSVPTSVAPHIASGRLRALAYTGELPVPGLELPSFEEAGLPGFDMSSWNGVFVPAGTPRPIIDRLAEEIGKILTQPDVKELLALQGQAPFYLDADGFADMLTADRKKYGDIIKASNIKLE
ncbi:tripartite tricarboxylate transporter substrate binding protein [Verticiella sediminum]|uniref:Tripartite tricarboxylate transporter substrate binding protein n=1 Tax=Verticiella sediminum TaxID=1247510 RepID=A0A556AFA5_9BURK|nr:tripartite tricarboxylate transporter substrate binding protein [Verticiella sediminum]TSH91576.1 tripartite tricarboxylate transporter substrate binding protein [Verticiella sediminum]